MAPPSKHERIPASTRTYESFFEHKALFEFSRVINSSLDKKFILGHILLTIMGKTLSTKGMVLLLKDGEDYAIEMVKGFAADLVGTSVRISSVPQSLFYVDKLDARRFPWIRFFRLRKVKVLLAMIISGRPVGFLAFGGQFAGRKLNDRERTYLRSLANISATAVEKSRTVEETRLVNRQLDHKVQQLNTLFDLSKEFGTLLDEEKQVRLLVFSLLGQIGVHRYLIALRSGPDMVIAASRIDGVEPQNKLLVSLSRIRKPVLIADLTVRDVPGVREILATIGMKVVVPMQVQGETHGIILLGEKLNKTAFTPADLEFLASLGNLAMISLENTRLFKETIEKQKMEDELLIARDIQKGLLPAVLPEIPGIAVAAANISSKQVGGDYYDMLALPGDGWLVAIGDVSGKGTPAALLMANLQATIRALVPLNIPLGELTGRVNDLMCHNTGGTRFVTFFWGIIDLNGRKLTYVNAGHNYPFLIRVNGSVVRLDKGGMILGVLKTTTPYEEATVDLVPGDLIVLFTDGVSEAMDRSGKDYGEERLLQLLLSVHKGDSHEVLNAIHQDVISYAGGAPQSDDITLMVVKVRT
jgi:sigma-B regulation protein RsbU (phosphoserine phosphatase)